MTTPNRLPALGFIGLGVMGRPMAAPLARAGYAMHLLAAAPQNEPDASVSELARWVERTSGIEIRAFAMEKT
ncbi:MAG: NAD(P)-binding domain-containing protein [Pseudomonadota bacterium]|nr:NAD(P)-binding domain-containing protein [Pseudomonadota bacterium]